MISAFYPPVFCGTNSSRSANLNFFKALSELPTNNYFESSDLIVVNNLDSGSYKYYTDYQPNQKGHFYLQVFDATTNQRLSKVEIEKQSIVLVDNLEENHWIGQFTVYEGGFTVEYVCRVELWYKTKEQNEYLI